MRFRLTVSSDTLARQFHQKSVETASSIGITKISFEPSGPQPKLRYPLESDPMSRSTSSASSLEFRVAKVSETREALSLVLGNVAPAARGAIVDSLSQGNSYRLGPLDALVVGVSNGQVVAAVWAQPQSGNSVTFWPPECLPNHFKEASWAFELLKIGIKQVDAAGVATSQILFESDEALSIAAFEQVGFVRIAELEYLGYAVGNKSGAVSKEENVKSTLDFEPYHESEYRRLARLVESTYEQSLDCPALTGQRNIDDTLTGYQATGNYRPENWFFVQHAGEDIGVLLLAEHELAEQYELVYMGLAPNSRKKGHAKPIIEQAKQTATGAGADQLMVAVDVTNTPAKTAYERAGFVTWAKRWAYVRSR